MPIKPTFSWNSADWATGYEFMLAKDAAFKGIVIEKTGADALTTTVYASDVKLDYATTYFWRVRAISATSYSEWGVSAFTTEAPPPSPTALPPPAPPPPSSPSKTPVPVYVWVVIAILSVLNMVVLVLILTTKRPPRPPVG